MNIKRSKNTTLYSAKKLRIGLLLITSYIAGCSFFDFSRAPDRTAYQSYQCDNGFSNYNLGVNKLGNNMVAIQHPEKGTMQLKKTISASGSRYSDGKTVLWLKGNEGFLSTIDSRVIDNCRSLQ